MAFPESIIEPVMRLLEMESDFKYRNEHPAEELHIIENIPYVEDDLEAHLLDILYPKNFKGNLPTILNIHGGGFSMNSKEDIYKIYALRLANEGYAVVNINYRLSTEAKFPAQIEDVFSVLNFLEKHHERYQLDLNRFFIVGDSAGAYLAAITECILTNPVLADYYKLSSTIKVRALGLNCGLYDFETTMNKDVKFPMKRQIIELLFGSLQYKKLPSFHYSSATNHVTKKFCPAYILDTEYFSFSPEAYRLKEKMDKLGIKNKLIIYPKKDKFPHVFQLMEKYSESITERKKMLEFFKQQKK